MIYVIACVYVYVYIYIDTMKSNYAPNAFWDLWIAGVAA